MRVSLLDTRDESYKEYNGDNDYLVEVTVPHTVNVRVTSARSAEAAYRKLCKAILLGDFPFKQDDVRLEPLDVRSLQVISCNVCNEKDNWRKVSGLCENLFHSDGVIRFCENHLK